MDKMKNGKTVNSSGIVTELLKALGDIGVRMVAIYSNAVI